MFIKGVFGAFAPISSRFLGRKSRQVLAACVFTAGLCLGGGVAVANDDMQNEQMQILCLQKLCDKTPMDYMDRVVFASYIACPVLQKVIQQQDMSKLELALALDNTLLLEDLSPEDLTINLFKRACSEKKPKIVRELLAQFEEANMIMLTNHQSMKVLGLLKEGRCQEVAEQIGGICSWTVPAHFVEIA